MCKPSRKIVSTDVLVTMMNQELQGYDVCEDCQFDGPILKLQSLAGDGCNWSDQVIIRCSGRSIWRSAMSPAIREKLSTGRIVL